VEFRIAHSEILNPRSSILDPQSSILDPQSSILNPRSSILDPRSSILNPTGARFLNQPRCDMYILASLVRLINDPPAVA
jgi:hypothetical protein